MAATKRGIGGDGRYRHARKKLIIEFFCGQHAVSTTFEHHGWQAVTESRCLVRVLEIVDIEDRFEPTICCDIRSLCPHAIKNLYGRPDFLWFSPPCTEFSRLNRKRRQDRNYAAALALVERCLEFVHILQPSRGYVIENPRGGDLSAFPVLAMVKRNAFDYCCFGNFPKKPTTLWNDLHHLHDQRCDGQRPESHHPGGKHRFRIQRGEEAAVIPPGLAEHVYHAVCRQAHTPERKPMGGHVETGPSPFDEGWKEQQLAGGCTNPYWRTNQDSFTIPVAQRRRCQDLRTLAKRIDEQPWRSERITEICGAFNPIKSTMVCWARWNGTWQPGRLCDINDLPDAGKGVERTCLDNFLTLSKSERQLDGKLLVNWLYEGRYSLIPFQHVRCIGDACIELPGQPVSKKKREALRQAKILSVEGFLIQRQELQHLKRGQKLLYQYNGVFDDQIDEQHNEWFELHLLRHIYTENATACVWELDVVHVKQSGRRQSVSHRERRDSAGHSCVFEPLDLDEAAGQGRLRRWFDWDDENETIGALNSETAQVAESVAAATSNIEQGAMATADDSLVLPASMLVGLRVRVLFSSSGWHLGVVQESCMSGKLLVEFDDGDKQEYTAEKVRSSLVDRLLFQRVSVPFHVPQVGRMQVYDGTVTSARNGQYQVIYDDGQTIAGYSKDDLSEYVSGRYAKMEKPQKQKQKQDQDRDQEVHSRPRRQLTAPRRFEAGSSAVLSTASRAAGISYIVPPDPSPAKRRRKGRVYSDPTARLTTVIPECNGDQLVGDTCSDEEDALSPEVGELSDASAAAISSRNKRVSRVKYSSVSTTRNDGETVIENELHSSQQHEPGVETKATLDALGTMRARGVQTRIGNVKPGDILSVRWDDQRWYAASVVFASTSRGIGLQYPESKKWKPWADVLRNFDAGMTSDRVRRCQTVECPSQRVTPSLPINHSRIPDVGDRVEVEYNEADDEAPCPYFVIYEGVCIQAAKQTLHGSATAQRLGYASAKRLPTQFKVKFPCGHVSLIVRGRHRWRKVHEEQRTGDCSADDVLCNLASCCTRMGEQQKQMQKQDQQVHSRPRRQVTAPTRFEAGPASRSRAAGISYIVPPDPSPAKRRRKETVQQGQRQQEPTARPTTAMPQRNGNQPVGDTCSDEEDVSSPQVGELSDIGAVATAKASAMHPSLPINHSRIPDVGDRVEVEYNEADDEAPCPYFVIYEGVCIQAAKQTLHGSAAAQRLGYASAKRLPTQFKVKFPCGHVSLIVRGRHRWRKVQ